MSYQDSTKPVPTLGEVIRASFIRIALQVPGIGDLAAETLKVADLPPSIGDKAARNIGKLLLILLIDRETGDLVLESIQVVESLERVEGPLLPGGFGSDLPS